MIQEKLLLTLLWLFYLEYAKRGSLYSPRYFPRRIYLKLKVYLKMSNSVMMVRQVKMAWLMVFSG